MNYSEIKSILKQENISDFAVIETAKIGNFETIENKLPKELDYLKRPERKNILLYCPEAKSVIICLYQYWNKEKNYAKELKKIKIDEILNERSRNKENIKKILNENFKIARYALVDEYHKKINENLKTIFNKIKEKEPSANGKIFIDTSPVSEKKLSEIAGLGIIGKNTLLINPQLGSYIFIGGIALNIKIENIEKRDKIKEKFCERCDLCEKKCPTSALKDYKLNYKRCISFWTTHTKNKKIPDFIKNASDYIFGCDICQEICPYNLKPQKAKTIF